MDVTADMIVGVALIRKTNGSMEICRIVNDWKSRSRSSDRLVNLENTTNVPYVASIEP